MPICGPSNAIPSCAATPSVGFGSENVGFGGALGLGGLGSIGSGYGGSVSAASLGELQGVPVDCIVQLRGSQVTLVPPPSTVVMPGMILSANPEGVEVGGYSPCAVPGYGQGLGYGGLGSGLLGSSGYNHGRGGLLGYGGLSSGFLGSRGLCNRRGSIFGRRGSICQ
ncbi:uncharacterized protein LOC144584937 [Pogona vitticeps]